MARITLNILFFFYVIPGKHPSYLEMLKVPWPFTIYLSTTSDLLDLQTALICVIRCPKTHKLLRAHLCTLIFLIFLKVADSSLTKVNNNIHWFLYPLIFPIPIAFSYPWKNPIHAMVDIHDWLVYWWDKWFHMGINDGKLTVCKLENHHAINR